VLRYYLQKTIHNKAYYSSWVVILVILLPANTYALHSHSSLKTCKCSIDQEVIRCTPHHAITSTHVRFSKCHQSSSSPRSFSTHPYINPPFSLYLSKHTPPFSSLGQDTTAHSLSCHLLLSASSLHYLTRRRQNRTHDISPATVPQ
jgi:hypothetical protein